jgi:hypothetical protein
MNPDTGRDNYNAPLSLDSGLRLRSVAPGCGALFEAALCRSRSPNDDATRDVSCLLRVRRIGRFRIPMSLAQLHAGKLLGGLLSKSLAKARTKYRPPIERRRRPDVRSRGRTGGWRLIASTAPAPIARSAGGFLCRLGVLNPL